MFDDDRALDEPVVCIWSAGLVGRSEGFDKTLPDKTQHWFATSAPSATCAVEHAVWGKTVRDFYEELVIGDAVAFDEDAREKGVDEGGSLMGSGSFGVVRAAVHKASGTRVVLKIVGREAAGPDYYRRMVENDGYHVSMQFQHPNKIRFFDQLLTSRHSFSAMQPLFGKELDDFMASQPCVTELLIQSIIRQSLSALQYIHSFGLMHRDVKNDSFRFERNDPDNPGKLVLFDFGLALQVQNPERLIVGTGPYMAPEVSSRKYGTPVDVWSLGVVLYTLITGDFPFQTRPMESSTVGEQERACALAKVELEQASPEALQFLGGLLTIDDQVRLTAEQALQHSWLSGVPDDLPSMDRHSQPMGADREKYEDLVTRRTGRTSGVHPPRRPSSLHKPGIWDSVLSLSCCSTRR